MGNRHPQNSGTCDNNIGSPSAVNNRTQSASDSAQTTPLHRSSTGTTGRLNKSVSDGGFSSSALNSAAMAMASRNYGAGTSASAGDRAPLKFHVIHGENVRLTNERRTATRTNSFCKALVFSDRSVGIDEMCCLKLSEVKTTWSGVLRFGITSVDPVAFDGTLPRYACPDMTGKGDTWAKAVSERFCQQGNIVHFFIRENGEMYYGINGVLKGLFLANVNTRLPMFIVVDIYGNTTSIEFVDESEVEPLRRAREEELNASLRPAIPPPPAIPLPIPPASADDATAALVASSSSTSSSLIPVSAGITRSMIGRPNSSSPVVAPLAAPEPSPSPRQQPNQQTVDTGTSSVQQHLNRELEQRLNFAQQQQRSLSSGTPLLEPPRVNSGVRQILTYNDTSHLIPMTFHPVRGRTITLTDSGTFATRAAGEFCNGYVFTSRPLRCNEKIVVQILAVDPDFDGKLAFGVTNCDPAELANYQFPDESEELSNRPEFWAVSKHHEPSDPIGGEEMTFYIDEEGKVIYQKNAQPTFVVMHLDTSLSYYMFFDLYGRVKTIRTVGTMDARIPQPPPPQPPPTIPQMSQHRRRAPHPQNRRGGPAFGFGNDRERPGTSHSSASASSTPVAQPPPPPGALLQNFQLLRNPQQQQRQSGLTVNLPPPPPDIPRRVEVGARQQPSAQQSDHPGGYSSGRGGPGPFRNYDYSHGRQGGPPPRPNRPPPPAPPQRTNSVPTAPMVRPLAQAAQSSQMARPASSSSVMESQAAASASASASTSSQAAAAAASSSKASGGSSAASVLQREECSICMDQLVNCAVYPCGHMCLCYDCGRTTWSRQGVCPICRQQIKDILRLFPN